MTTPPSRRSSKRSRLSSSGAGRGTRAETRSWPSSSTSTAFTIRDGGTQHWAGKARSPSNGKWPKRALGAAQKRDTSKKGDEQLWKVRKTAREGGKRVAYLERIGAGEPESQTVPTDDLIAAAEFRDFIYPGLISTGKVKRGGDKPYHTVINGENFHALEALTFIHRGKIDAIYIDPPYNTGAKYWKYNNDYVEGDDLYSHSKWLAFVCDQFQPPSCVLGCIT